MGLAGRLLLLERDAILPILQVTPPADFDRPTACEGWSVRDVLAHCGAALTDIAMGTLHGFTPQENEREVRERRQWPLERVLDELRSGYGAAARAIDAAGGAFDGIGLGEWIHGGDVREALGTPDAYASAGHGLATDLLVERSRRLQLTPVEVTLPTRTVVLGVVEEGMGLSGHLRADTASFVRLCSGRPADASRYTLTGIEPDRLNMFGQLPPEVLASFAKGRLRTKTGERQRHRLTRGEPRRIQYGVSSGHPRQVGDDGPD